MSTPLLILGLVAAQRLMELAWAARNTRRLMAAGATEHGRRHYPWFVLLHAAWLGAMAAFVPPDAPIYGAPMILFLAAQAARVWAIHTLGAYWTTRIVTLDGAPLVRHGPYRYLRHPNYLVVAVEIVALPLAFGAWWIAATFGALNLALLTYRIRIEDRVLGPRRASQCPSKAHCAKTG